MHWKRNVQSASPCDLSPLTLSFPSVKQCPLFQPILILLFIKFAFSHKFCVGSSSLFDSMGWHILSSWNTESSKWRPKCFICSPHVWHSIAIFISWYLHGYSRFLSLQVELWVVFGCATQEPEENSCCLLSTTSAPKMAFQHQNCINKMFI